MSTQRAFTQKLSKQHASDVRKTVYHKTELVTSASTSWPSDIAEPLDFEEFISSYQLVLDRDPLKAILDVPLGDVHVDLIERPIRTLQPIIPEEKLDSLLPHVQIGVKCYTSGWKVIRYTYRHLSSSILTRFSLPKSFEPSPTQEFEVDFQNVSETTSELDTFSQGSSSRHSIISSTSISSCEDTLTPRNSWASFDLRHPKSNDAQEFLGVRVKRFCCEAAASLRKDTFSQGSSSRHSIISSTSISSCGDTLTPRNSWALFDLRHPNSNDAQEFLGVRVTRFCCEAAASLRKDTFSQGSSSRHSIISSTSISSCGDTLTPRNSWASFDLRHPKSNDAQEFLGVRVKRFCCEAAASLRKDTFSQGSSSRHCIISSTSISSCGDTLTPRNSWASFDLRHPKSNDAQEFLGVRVKRFCCEAAASLRKDTFSQGSSSRHSIILSTSISSCGDTLTPRNSWASFDLRHPKSNDAQEFLGVRVKRFCCEAAASLRKDSFSQGSSSRHSIISSTSISSCGDTLTPRNSWASFDLRHPKSNDAQEFLGVRVTRFCCEAADSLRKDTFSQGSSSRHSIISSTSISSCGDTLTPRNSWASFDLRHPKSNDAQEFLDVRVKRFCCEAAASLRKDTFSQGSSSRHSIISSTSISSCGDTLTPRNSWASFDLRHPKSNDAQEFLDVRVKRFCCEAAASLRKDTFSQGSSSRHSIISSTSISSCGDTLTPRNSWASFDLRHPKSNDAQEFLGVRVTRFCCEAAASLRKDTFSQGSSSRHSIISSTSISSCGDTLTPRNSWALFDLRHPKSNDAQEFLGVRVTRFCCEAAASLRKDTFSQGSSSRHSIISSTSISSCGDTLTPRNSWASFDLRHPKSNDAQEFLDVRVKRFCCEAAASLRKDTFSQGSSSRHSIISSTSISSCGDTLTPRNSWASFDLRHSAGDSLIPEILEQVDLDSQDQVNETKRQIDRQENLFSLTPNDLYNIIHEPVEKRLPAHAPSEHLGHRVLVKCMQLTMDVEIEPLFASMALYDCKERKKVSETFYFDLNPEGLKRMLGGHVPYSDVSTLARNCIFNISHPSPDLFIVVRLEKVLQGDINDCVEPYLKEDKNRDKLKTVAISYCERLGKYRQAFAWTAINVFNVINGGNALERDLDKDFSMSSSNTNSLDRKSSGSSLDQLRRKASDMSSNLGRRGSLERKDKCRSWSPDDMAVNFDNFRPITLTMSSFFKQESDKLRDEDLYKCLQELKRPTLVLKKLKCIPATFKLEISPCPIEYKNCLTAELAKLHPYSDEKGRPTKELLELPIKEILTPHYTYQNLLFVSPKELNYSNRTGSARNLAVRIQLMCGEEEKFATTNIFGKSSCPEMTNEAFTAVTYHCKTPVYYDEIKIKLPALLADNHHLLFTFYHISCQKKADQNVVESPVGYTWLPLLRDGRLVSGEFCLPIMLEVPPRNYSYIPPDVFLPGTKWLDNHKGLFTVVLDTASSIHTHDPSIERFFAAYDYVHTGIIPTRLGEVGSEKELIAAMVGLAGARSEALVKNMPQIFDSVIELLVQPPKISGHTVNIGSTCFETLCLLLENLSNLQELSVDHHGRIALLDTYIQYQCNLPHPMNVNNSDWNSATSLFRSNSNPDFEVSQYQPRGLDRAASMRVPTNEQLSPTMSSCPRIVHQELAYQWTIATGRHKELAMQNSWFLFELIMKSMVEHLAYGRSLDVPRKSRFPDQFLDDISTLVQNVTADIIAHSTGETRKAHKLNASLAFFFFDLLSIADRGWVFQMLRYYNKEIQAKVASVSDAGILVELKLEFVRIICSHEHYVAFNLPFATPFMSSGASVSPSPSVTSSTSQNSYLSGTPASQERSGGFAELSFEYKQHHYLTGLVLSDLATVLLDMHQPSLHHKAVDTVKNLLSWHDGDPRYSTPDLRHRVAALYLPLLTITMDVLPLLHNFSPDKNDRYAATDDSNNINPSVAMVIAGKLPPSSVNSFQSRKVGISGDVTKNLLTCALWVLKNIENDSLTRWLNELSSSRISTFLHLLEACTNCFEYRPKRRVINSGFVNTQANQDVKSRLEDMILGQGSAREMMQRRKVAGASQSSSDKLRWRKEQMSYRISTGTEVVDRPKDENLLDSQMEGHFATEASFIVLDTLERCVSIIVQFDSQQHLVGLALAVLLNALGKNQSTTVLPHMFASQRSLVFKFHSALFDEESVHCADLCLLLLKHCGSQIASVRSQAAASLYLLMRHTFQIGNNFARIKMQVTMSLSSLVGTSATFSDDSLRRSLKTILEYGEKDTEMQDSTFPEQVRDLIFNLHMILSDTVKMKEFQEDPEMLLDLMYRIAKGYQNSPDLRLTWLANMAQKHMERGNHTEAGMCLVHSAALVAEYLAMLESLPHLPAGAATLERISPNVLEESAVSDDVLSSEREVGCLGSHFTEAGLLGLLEHAASSFHAAAMYEPMNDIYRVLIPIAENSRDFKKLSNIHGKLHDAYTRIEQLHGKRMFGTYFRVGFYGSKFGDLDKEEFIYKEPTLTKLPEIFSRLENFYAERFGSENVIIIKDSNIVDPVTLDAEKAYIQITYVEPYFEPFELRYRQTHFDKNFNIKRFMYATPFTMTGKPHGELKDQYKRKTILTTAVHFPYVKTRVQVVTRTQITLTPIEVAIEDIQKKTMELAVATNQEPPDPKILQMVLQGCIGTTVNQGPLEMATTFLPSNSKTLTKHQNKLRLCFKDFSKKCSDALRKNKNLIGPDQRDYQRELDRNYKRFIEKLQPLVSPQSITILNTSPYKYIPTDSSVSRLF